MTIAPRRSRAYVGSDVIARAHLSHGRRSLEALALTALIACGGRGGGTGGGNGAAAGTFDASSSGASGGALSDGAAESGTGSSGYIDAPFVDAGDSAQFDSRCNTLDSCSAGGWCSVDPEPIVPASSPGENSFGWSGAVWGSGPSDVWAVGGASLFVPVPTALLHWNGCVWSPVASGTSAVLNAVWGSAPNDVWAVGGGSASGPTDGNFGPSVILHWNGSVWSSASWSPPPGDSTVLQGVWGSGPDDVWAVGSASLDPAAHQTAVLHWDGKTWTVVDLNGLTPDGLDAVWGSGPNDVWAVGFQERDLPQSAIVHWDGSAWSMVLCPTTQPLSAVWGSGPSDVWAASGYQGGSAIIHWDGSVWSVWWSETNSDLTTMDEVSFTSLWGSGSADVWAVANHGDILHWDGSAWSKSLSGTANDLIAVWGSGPGDIWSVGAAGCTTGLTCPETILHRAGAGFGSGDAGNAKESGADGAGSTESSSDASAASGWYCTVSLGMDFCECATSPTRPNGFDLASCVPGPFCWLDSQQTACLCTAYAPGLAGSSLVTAVATCPPNFGNVPGPGGNLIGTNQNGADISDAILSGAMTYGLVGGCPASLPLFWICVDTPNAGYVLAGPGANLTGANLTGADLSNATLVGAMTYNLVGGCPASLPTEWICVDTPDVGYVLAGPGVNLSGANLTGANLAGADLAGAYLVNATLVGVAGVTYSSLTQCPNGSFYGTADADC